MICLLCVSLLLVFVADLGMLRRAQRPGCRPPQAAPLGQGRGSPPGGQLSGKGVEHGTEFEIMTSNCHFGIHLGCMIT